MAKKKRKPAKKTTARKKMAARRGISAKIKPRELRMILEKMKGLHHACFIPPLATRSTMRKDIKTLFDNNEVMDSQRKYQAVTYTKELSRLLIELAKGKELRYYVTPQGKTRWGVYSNQNRYRAIRVLGGFEGALLFAKKIAKKNGGTVGFNKELVNYFLSK